MEQTEQVKQEIKQESQETTQSSSKVNFYVRLGLFIIFSLIVPIAYLSIRFNLFSSSKNISIWGILVLGVLVGVVAFLIKYYIDGVKTRYTTLKKVLLGLIRLILPLTILLGVLIFLKVKADWILNNLNLAIEAVSIILACETLGIIIEPISKWAFDNNVDGLVEICDKVFHRAEQKDEKQEGESK